MQEGLIIENISNTYIVSSENSIFRCTAKGKLKKEKVIPVVGDRVNIEIVDNNTGVIDNILTRSNYIKRPKLANITQIIFVVSIKMPYIDLFILDKQIAFAEYLNIKCAIVINKIDLDKDKNFLEIENKYKNIGYKVITTSIKEKVGNQNLRKILQNNISAFAGKSGVGKSTLINSIFPNIAKEGQISKKTKQGKNTTTNVKLYEINSNSFIADTPGFSSFDLFEIPSKDLHEYFIEFNNYISDCSYIGCTHIKEEHCGIKKALEYGYISQSRYENYCKIYNELKNWEVNKW